MDIDIDLPDRSVLLDKIKHIAASRIDGETATKHNTGVYLQHVPYSAAENRCALDFREAEKQGYFKIDFLNVSAYNGVRNEQHLLQLMQQEPIWELLEQQEIVDQLFHVNGHAELLKKLKPKSVLELAAVLAIIRPAKRHLANESWDKINKEVWTRPTNDDYYFKKSHALSYAMVVVVQLNLICEQALEQSITV